MPKYDESLYIQVPDDGTTIWKYLSLDKLLALLVSSELHLTRLDQFKDPWEGALSRTSKHLLEEILSTAQDKQLLMEQICQAPRLAFVNCWHASDYESAALWDQYGKNAGISIRSSVGRLKESIRSRKDILIGSVKYIDYQIEEALKWRHPNIQSVFSKRKSFEHEREIRIARWEYDVAGRNPKNDKPKFLKLRVDLSTILESIQLSPESPTWMLPTVMELFRRFDLGDVSIKRSSLYDPILR